MRRPSRIIMLTLIAAMAAGPGAAGAIQAQDPVRVPEVAPLFHDPSAVAVPFGPGERLEYQVKLGVFSVGEGFMSIDGVEDVRGHPSYRIRMAIRGGMLFAKVNDKYDSWLGTQDLVSRRYIRDIHEVNYKSRREFAIYPEERRWERVDADQDGTMNTSQPLDEIAFIYYLRTLPLEVGKTYTLNRYFKEDGNPVVIKVLRRERKEVPAGTFNTIVVQPIIQTDGLFSEGGNAEVYLTDDADRHLVYLRSEIPVVGSVTLHLKGIREGTPLNPARGR